MDALTGGGVEGGDANLMEEDEHISDASGNLGVP
jgi:hypothetical protein